MDKNVNVNFLANVFTIAVGLLFADGRGEFPEKQNDSQTTGLFLIFD